MRKKKVLILASSLDTSGGAQKDVSNLSLVLSKYYKISITTVFHSNNLYPFKGSYFTFNERIVYRDMIRRVLRIRKIVKLTSPDIIITFMRRIGFSVIIAKYLFRFNIPILINISSNPDRNYRKRVYGKILIRLLYPKNKVNFILTVSKNLKDILINNYKIKGEKIFPMYNSIDMNYISQLSREVPLEHKNLFNNEKILKFITVGRLSKEKGHEILIKAFSKVVQEIPNSVLFILGEGLMRKKLETLIKTNKLDNKVFLLGFIENPYKYLSKADIFVLSSFFEGLPYSLIEALASGLPIIATDCETGPREILGNGKFGLLSKVGDVKDLTEKMIYLVNNVKLRKKLSKKRFKELKSSIKRNIILIG